MTSKIIGDFSQLDNLPMCQLVNVPILFREKVKVIIQNLLRALRNPCGPCG
jgi:hypothetical protein